MSEVINTNVFSEDKKFVDIAGLRYFWEKTKGYVDGVDGQLSGRISVNEGAIKAINDELNSLSGGAGSIQTQIQNAISELDLPNTYDAKGSAATAEQNAKDYADGKFQVAGNYEVAGAAAQALVDAKAYADGLAGNYDAAGTAAGLNTAMDARVVVLEAIDHDKLASDAAASAVATVLDDAPEKFDTLKEIAEWIQNTETASTAADLVTRVATLEAIDHEAYVAADTALETSLKGYVDGKVDGKFDTVGSAAQALADAKTYTNEEIGKLSYDAAGSAEAALAEAKTYADGKDSAMNTRVAKLEAIDHTVYAKSADVYVKSEIDAAVEAAKNAAIADAATKLNSYYTKTEVDNLLATNTAADQAYAKNYTDALFNSFKFAQNSEIDALFA